MIKVYRSKIEAGIVIFLVIIFGFTGYLVFSNGFHWAALLVFALCVIVTAYIFFSIKYIVSGTLLNVKCGFLTNLYIDIHTIKSISETDNMLSSPAASFDRLEIRFGKYDNVLVSPKNKEDVINALLFVNPDIEIKLRH
ncbi:PH domain-containing protein [Limibacterium fermenti]|uniref:PH domain-containing protein n=1 Tax=Limibacterium fermenti TaxID=3229863 RepID=UPI003A7A8BEF